MVLLSRYILGNYALKNNLLGVADLEVKPGNGNPCLSDSKVLCL